MAQMIFPPLEQLVPHRPPMILLTRMVEAGPTTAVCEVDIGADTLFCDGDAVSAFVGIEYMAQAVAAYSGYQRYCQKLPAEVGFLLGAPKFKSYCHSFRRGQTLRVEVEHTWGESQLWRFECVIKDARTGELLQQGQLNVFKPESLDTILQALNQ